MTTVAVRAVSCAAPGMLGWEAARACLAGEAAWRPEPLGKLAPAWLPANERRRLSATMRLALFVGEQALEASDCDPQTPASVFASAAGDGDIIHSICEELARAEPAVSPTRFHNSVHNAPAGYWAIAARSHGASTAIAAHDASFAAGWIEAALLAAETCAPVLLVAYDQPLPAPLNERRHFAAPFACALLLDGNPEVAALAHIGLQLTNDSAETCLADPDLEVLRRSNPAARALPLLELLAKRASGTIALPYTTGAMLALEVSAKK
ncbi:MAG: beta-ketoacyl synthase chain length factor [Gammaproteobacteria bacterium]